MIVGCVRGKVHNGSHDLDAVGWLRIAAEKIVLSQRPNQPIAAKQGRQSFDHRSFAAAIGADKNGVPPEDDFPFANATEVLD